jgi:hypothetical protein
MNTLNKKTPSLLERFFLKNSQSGALGRDEVNPIVVTDEYFK